MRGVLRKVAEHSDHLVPVGLASLFGRRTPLKQCRFHIVADLNDVANFWIFLRPHHELLDISFNLPFRGRRGPSSCNVDRHRKQGLTTSVTTRCPLRWVTTFWTAVARRARKIVLASHTHQLSPIYISDNKLPRTNVCISSTATMYWFITEVVRPMPHSTRIQNTFVMTQEICRPRQ